MKILNILLIVSLLAFIVTGCQKQVTPNTPAGQAAATANTPVTTQTQIQPANTPPDQTADNNITVGDNPDIGDVSAPSVDTTSLT